jgi:hypothetical protein
MNMRLPALALALALAFALTGLSGCLFETETRVAGGAEDFPNTLAALGASTATDLSAHADWDQFSNLPQVDLGSADSLVGNPAPLVKATAPVPASAKAARAAQAAPDTVWDLSDTATLGVGRRYIRDSGLVRIQADTTVFRWDDRARDGIAGNETLLEDRGGKLFRSRLEAYRYENLDSAGGFDRGTFYEADLKATGAVQHRLIVVMPGSDGDFAARADNRPVYFATARTRDGDTLDVFEVEDADGDGRLWGEHDSGLVEVRHRQTDPLLRPAVASFTQRMRAMFFRQTGKTYPISYSETRIDTNGRKVSFSVKGYRDGADSTFGPGDTVTVTVRTTPSPGSESRFEERTARYRIRLADAPGQHAGNTLMHFSMETRWREGAFRKRPLVSTRLAFVPDGPVPAGTASVTGRVKVEAVFADGGTGTLDGSLAERRLTGDKVRLVGGPRPGLFRVVWDGSEAGKVLETEALPDSE